MTDIEYLDKYYSGDINEAIKRLENGEAIQYIVGNVDFYGRIFNVDKRVLIPRFETEELISRTIKYIDDYFDFKPSILDIGTGSGCIAITLSLELKCSVDALDISEYALEVAKDNCSLNSADVNFIKSDLFENVHKKYDVIISNPPYISIDEQIDDVVFKNEPHLALYAQDKGLAIYKKIFKSVENYINNKAFLAFEIGYRQGRELVSCVQDIFPQANVWVEKDLSGKDRFLFVKI